MPPCMNPSANSSRSQMTKNHYPSSPTETLGAPPLEQQQQHQKAPPLPSPNSSSMSFPSESDLDAELAKLTERLSSSKVSFDARHQSLSKQLATATDKIEPLQKDIDKVKGQVVRNGPAKLTAIRRRRDLEAEKVQIKQLQLSILKYVCRVDQSSSSSSSSATMNARDIVRKTKDIAGRGFIENVNEVKELIEIRERLQDIHRLFEEGTEKERSKDFEVQLLGKAMKRQAIANYCSIREDYQIS